MIKRNTISANEKLKSRKAIEQIFAARQSFSTDTVRVFYLLTDEECGIVKAGFGASKKYLKHAVKRNRAKRLMREAYRTQKHTITEAVNNQEKSLYVFFLFSKNELINYSEMQNTISVILQRLEKIIQKNLTEKL